MRGLTIRSHELANGWLSIAVEGEVDLATVGEFQAAIDDGFAASTDKVVVDLTSTSFMDSTGLKALVVSSRKFEEAGRDFAVVVGAGPVARLIDLSGVDATLTVVESTDALD